MKKQKNNQTSRSTQQNSKTKIYGGTERDREEQHATTLTMDNITFCYEGEYTPKNLEKRQHLKVKEVYTDGSKNPGKNVGLAAVF